MTSSRSPSSLGSASAAARVAGVNRAIHDSSPPNRSASSITVPRGCQTRAAQASPEFRYNSATQRERVRSVLSAGARALFAAYRSVWHLTGHNRRAGEAAFIAEQHPQLVAIRG